MLNNRDAILALRNRLLTVVVADTGPTTLTATGTGYTRSAGSFITDGFTVGMEVVPAGFANNPVAVIESVTPTEIIVSKSRTSESAGADRSLTVGIPLIRGWENREFVPIDGRWYMEEDYLPGPTAKITMPNDNAQLEHIPQYVVRIVGPTNYGVTALFEVIDAVLRTFKPGAALVLSDGNYLRVRTNPAPYAGQLLPDEAGRVGVAITIPLIARTTNPT